MLSFEQFFFILLIVTVALVFVVLFRITEPPVKTFAEEKLSVREKTTPNARAQTDSQKCPYGFGYLKKRDKNAPIPDECLSCPSMLRCVSSSE